MKKIIYISGIVIIVFILLGALFKLMHWPGASILLILGLGSFSFWFLPAALLNNYRKANMKHWKWVYIVTFITFFIDTMGALFKIQHWPGAGWLLITGITLPFILFLPFFIYRASKEKAFPIINFMGVMFGLTFLSVFTALLALNVSKSVLNHALISTHQNILAYNYNNEGIQGEGELNQLSSEICSYVDELTNTILVTKENAEKLDNSIDYEALTISQYWSEDEINAFMLGSEEIQGATSKLKTMLTEYRVLITKMPGLDPELNRLAEDLLDTSSSLIRSNEVTWEDRESFYASFLNITISSLTRIKENVRFIEHEIQSELYADNLISATD